MKKIIYLILLMYFTIACKENDEEKLYRVKKTGTFVDARDNHEYKWETIGDQIWMTENLSYLPAVNLCLPDSSNLPHYYIYGYNGTDVNEAKGTSNYVNYGVLYDWNAAVEACPAGWHLPSDAEWKQLEIELGMTNKHLNEYIGTFDRGNQGTQMKSASGWHNEGNGTNISGFTGIPGGYRFGNGNFTYVGSIGYWWSSTDNQDGLAWGRGLRYNSCGVCRNIFFKDNGFSIRCIKN